MLTKSEVYVSFDIETAGPIPGVHSMLSLGAVAFDHKGRELDHWYYKLTHVYAWDHATREWWNKFPEAFVEATSDLVSPKIVMERFDAWLRMFRPCKPVLMASPAAWDGMFLNWYAQTFLGRFLCTKHRVLDIRTYTMAKWDIPFNGYPSTFKKVPNPFPHHALHDAREQGQQFMLVALGEVELP